jgi:hypothetical protein
MGGSTLLEIILFGTNTQNFSHLMRGEIMQFSPPQNIKPKQLALTISFPENGEVYVLASGLYSITLEICEHHKPFPYLQ